MAGRQRAARRRSSGVVAAGLLLAAVGVGSYAVPSADEPPAAPPEREARTASTQVVRRVTGPVPAKVVSRRLPAGPPRRVSIPALGVDAAVVPVHAPGGTLVPPDDPGQLGWWVDGAQPGARRGSALLTGHTVHTGGGALDDLEQARRGDVVTVRTDRGTIDYVVDEVRVYSKGRIAEDASRLFSQRVPGRLVVVTCEDWDGEEYLSNVVVTATPSS